ncbi:MAG: hypothetical protein LBF19_07860 [Prevotellaceae bacterium]|jgi:hypothetical protein|nr:hypothetical protein [Prevotellaceae bacterium]
MKKTKILHWVAICATTMMMAIAFACSSGANDDPDPNTGGDTTDVPTPPIPVDLHESLKGSDYYVIYLDDVSFAALGGDLQGTRVKKKLLPDDVVNTIFNWITEGTGLLTYDFGTANGPNAYGQPEGYMAWVVSTHGWSGGGFLLNTDLTELSNNAADYHFHFAIKSPTNQPNAGYQFNFGWPGVPRDGEIKIYAGPPAQAPANTAWVEDYPHDGEWHHFDVPMSTIAGRGWIWPSSGEGYLPSFSSGGVAGTEFNLDAVFIYKKAASAN